MFFSAESYGKFIVRYPWLVVIASLVFAALAIAGVQHLRFTNDYRYFFSKENPYLTAFEELERTYSSPDTLLYVYQPRDDSPATSREALQMVEEITEAGWQVPFSTRVDSITNFQNTRAIGEDDLEVRSLIEDAGSASDAQIDYAVNTVINEPLLAGRLLSHDQRTGAVLVSLRPPTDDPLATNSIVVKAREIKAAMEAKYPGIRLELTGSQMLSNAFSEAAQRDLSTLTPLMFVLITIVLVLTTRNLFGTLATMLIVGLSAVMAMGTGGWMGTPLSPPTAGAPTIILTIAVADCVHILITALIAIGRGADKKQAIIESLTINAQPVFLTSVTTAIGLFSLNFSDAPPYRDLGTLAGIGTIYAWMLSMALFPALLAILPMRASKAITWQSHAMEWISERVIRHRKPLLIAMATFTIIGVSLIPRLTFNDRFVDYFDERMDFRVASDWAADNLTGIYILNYSMPGLDTGAVSEPEYLQTLDKFAGWLRQQPEIKHVASFSDIIKRINRSMNGDQTRFYDVPENRELAAQYLLLYEMSLPYGLDLNDQLNVDKSASRMVVTLSDLGTSEMKELQNRARIWLQENAPAHMVVDPSGQSVMFAYIGERNMQAMTSGTIIAFLLISACLMLALRSLRLGLISLIPNMAPPAVALGLFSLYQSDVGFWTSFVTVVAIGLIVDATVHMLTKYRHARVQLNYSAADAVRYSFAMVGTALWVSTFILIVGFMVLTQSPFLINSMLGMVVSMTIFMALMLDFLMLPPLLIAIDSRGEDSSKDSGDEPTPNLQPAE